jgi:nitrite reductase/ring-hydroxylating ferredoxin subunit
MPERPAIPGPQRLCASADLAERSTAQVFDVRVYGQPARAFALRVDGQAVAFLNRCAHVPTEMDWTPGEFLDAERRYIVCTFHGALYEPQSGRCVQGPCRGQRLTPVPLRESEGQVWWLPTLDIHPETSPVTTPEPSRGSGSL